MKKIAIFGAHGSLAKSLASYLKKKNYEIIGFSSKKIFPKKNFYDKINYFNLNQKNFSYKNFQKFKTAIIFSHSFQNLNLNVKGLNKLKVELNKVENKNRLYKIQWDYLISPVNLKKLSEMISTNDYSKYFVVLDEEDLLKDKELYQDVISVFETQESINLSR